MECWSVFDFGFRIDLLRILDIVCGLPTGAVLTKAEFHSAKIFRVWICGGEHETICVFDNAGVFSGGMYQR
jgi:hypothetical protein